MFSRPPKIKTIKNMENRNWRSRDVSIRSIVAGLLLVGGLICGIYFLVFFDTSVEIPVDVIMGQAIGGEQVNNIGLMQDRQNGIYLGFGAAIVGLALEFFGERRRNKE
jgi:hypothetical protein